MTDFQALIEKFPLHKKRLLKMEKDLRLAQMRDELKDHPVIHDIIETTQASIEAINMALLHNRKLGEVERKELLAERDTHEWYQRVFTGAEEQIKKIQQHIEKYEQR